MSNEDDPLDLFEDDGDGVIEMITLFDEDGLRIKIYRVDLLTFEDDIYFQSCNGSWVSVFLIIFQYIKNVTRNYNAIFC